MPDSRERRVLGARAFGSGYAGLGDDRALRLRTDGALRPRPLPLALIVVELGLITPPVGMNVFIISAQAPEVPMRQTFLGVLPFFGAELVRVAVLVAFTVLTLWLPEALSG